MIHTEKPAARWKRRAVTIPAYCIAALMWLPLGPIGLLLTGLVDFARAMKTGRRWMASRLWLFGGLYLWAELIGLTRLAFTRDLTTTFAIQNWWTGALSWGLRWLFGLRIEVSGDEVLSDGPYLLFMRHASIADVLLPAALVARPHGVRLRYLLKRELLWDPCMDVAGQRLPNVFVRRYGSDTEGDLRAVSALTKGLEREDGIVVFPEGTRFTPRKRERALRALADGPFAERAAALTRVLPPRLGGALVLLDAGVDVVFCAHEGMDQLTGPLDFWNDSLRDRPVRVHFWRMAASEVPSGATERADWLYEEWARVDAWCSTLSLEKGSNSRAA